MKCFVLAALAVASASGSCLATILTEDFPDPLSGYYTRWLGQNSNLGSVYLAGDCNLDSRGNNPSGIWVFDTQQCFVGGGDNGNGSCDITINPSFAPTLKQISFGIESFVGQTVHFFDGNGNDFFDQAVSGGSFPLDYDTTVDSGFSATGISRILFDSGSCEGNTAIDNVVANVQVPAPGAGAVLGIAGLAAGRRRR